MCNESNNAPYMGAKIEHLKMIQAIISRMGNNGFLLKGWGLTIATAMLALAVESQRFGLLLAGLGPIVVFWGLDAFFLYTETKYRKLYEAVASISPDQPVDFNLNPDGPWSTDVGSSITFMTSKVVGTFWVALYCTLLLAYALASRAV